MSREIDMLPIADTNDETARLADEVEGVAGEWSPFEQQHGFGTYGVDLTTVTLPDGWRTRLVKVQKANTAAPSGQPRFTRWCLNPHDLCSATMYAGREKDRNVVGALITAGLVVAAVLRERLRSTDGTSPAHAWLDVTTRDGVHRAFAHVTCWNATVDSPSRAVHIAGSCPEMRMPT